MENSGDRNPIDLLAEEFAARCREGAAPSIEEYASKYPQWADDIRMLFPPVAMMEELKRKRAVPASADAQPHSRALEKLGDFKIIRELGRGGMGIVYEALQVTLGRRVALKVLPRHSLLDESRLQRFQREAQAAARLHHTNIVSVFGSGESEGLHYYVMQLIEGKPLNEILERLRNDPAKPIHGDATRPPKGTPSTLDFDPESVLPPVVPLPPPVSDSVPDKGPPVPAANSGAAYWRWVAQAGIQVADALFYAHRQGTLHRDIKPANILLDTDGCAWITDFGLAKIAAGEDLTETGDLIGTLQYMAPEMFQGPADARSDLYSLGLVLFEMLTLRLPFDAASAQSMIRDRLTIEPQPVRKFNAEVPRDLETIVMKTISQEPSQRYVHAADLADDLRRFIDDRPVLARPVGAVERLVRWRRRNPVVAGLGLAAAASLLLALVAGSVGYIQTTAALERESQRRAEADEAKRSAEANVQMCLQAFEQIFNQLDAANVRPDGPPPDERPGPPPPDGIHMLDGLFPPPIPDDHGPRNRDGFHAPPRPEMGKRPPVRESKEILAMLQSILEFYDHFVEKNQTNATLQAQAAKACGRVGEIQQRLGDREKAEASYLRAIRTFGDLKHRGVNLSAPEDLVFLAHTKEQLGVLQRDAGRFADADKNFQEALGLQDLAVRDAPPDDEGARKDQYRARLAYCDFLLQQKRPKEARSILESSMKELRPRLIAFDHLRPWMGLHYRCLAEVLKSLGDAVGAANAQREADTYPALLPPGNHPPPPPPEN